MAALACLDVGRQARHESTVAQARQADDACGCKSARSDPDG